MARINVPRKDLNSLKGFIDLSNNQHVNIIHILKNIEKGEQSPEIKNKLISTCDVDNSFSTTLLQFIFSLKVTQLNLDIKDDDLIENVLDNLLAVFPELDNTDGVIKNTIIDLITIDNFNLKILSKSLNTINENDNVYLNSKIINDIRPILLDGKIGGVMLYHSLKLTFIENDDSKDFYVALDTKDLEKLYKTIGKSLEEVTLLKEKFSSDLIFTGYDD